MNITTKIFSLLFAGGIAISSVASAQDNMAKNTSDFSKLNGIGISFGAYDFYGPQTNKYFGDNVTSINYNIFTSKNDTSVKKKFRWEPLVHINYWFMLSKSFSINMGLSAGNATYPSKSDDSTYKAIRETPVSKYKILVLEADVRANYFILPMDKYIAVPYVFAGLVGSFHAPSFGADIPVGLGLHLNCPKADGLSLSLEAAYEAAVTSTDQTHMQYLVGFNYWFTRHYKATSK